MGDSAQDTIPGRAIVVQGVVRAGASVAGVAGVVLLAGAAATRRVDLLALGLLGLTVMLVALVQLVRDRPGPVAVLAVTSGGIAAILPTVEGATAVFVLPALTLIAFLGVFSLSRRTAFWLALWCGVVAVWSAPWIFPGMSFAEIVVSAFLLGAIGTAGWRILSLAGDALIHEYENYRFLFDSSPVAMFEEDFTAVQSWLEELRSSGVSDLRSYLAERPDEVRKGHSLIRVTRVNPAAVRMTESESSGEMPNQLVIRQDTELDGFIEQFLGVWEGQQDVALDLEGYTSRGRPLEGVLHWSVPVSQGSFDLSRVVVTISDITPRKVIEESLARAVKANERLLSFEQALVSCSRALLLGTGEEALQIALQTLREAINADRAYLAVNLDDPEGGSAFRVVNSASKPTITQEDALGKVFPWGEYPMAYRSLSSGESYRQPNPGPDEEWNGSLLVVPIFSGELWIGHVGFVNYGRRTEWSDDAARMLEVAAPMLGTFWEREGTRLRLEELVESKDRFLATVSHELRTPLAAVLGFAEELKSHAPRFQPEELTEMLELIADQSQDMTDMVEDLLVAARAKIGTVSMHLQDVYLRSQAEAVLAGIGSVDMSSVRVVGAAGKAWADPTRTRQIIRNLLINAVRYGGGEVVVEATTDGAHTVLTVRDDGPGLPESDWERIFDPYEQAHEQPTQPGSMGLGLTVSRQLARLMGGNLVYRVDQSGSVFELSLPSGDSDTEASEPDHHEKAVLTGQAN